MPSLQSQQTPTSPSNTHYSNWCNRFWVLNPQELQGNQSKTVSNSSSIAVIHFHVHIHWHWHSSSMLFALLLEVLHLLINVLCSHSCSVAFTKEYTGSNIRSDLGQCHIEQTLCDLCDHLIVRFIFEILLSAISVQERSVPDNQHEEYCAVYESLSNNRNIRRFTIILCILQLQSWERYHSTRNYPVKKVA